MAKNVKKKKKALKKGAVDSVVDSGKGTINFLQKKASPLFVDLLKIEAGSTILLIAVLVMGVFAMWGLGLIPESFDFSDKENFASEMIKFLPLIAGLAVAMLVGGILSTIFESVGYNAVDLRMKNSKVRILERFSRNFLPVLSLIVLLGVIQVIIFFPPILSLLSRNVTLMFLSFVLFMLSAIVLVIFLFFVQFVMLELVINGRGPWESIKQSYSLVKNNFWGVLVFDIAYWVIAMALGSVMGVISYVFQLFVYGGLMVSPLLGIAFAFILMFIIGLVYNAITKTIMLPFQYKFWKGIQVL